MKGIVKIQKVFEDFKGYTFIKIEDQYTCGCFKIFAKDKREYDGYEYYDYLCESHEKEQKDFEIEQKRLKEELEDKLYQLQKKLKKSINNRVKLPDELHYYPYKSTHSRGLSQ